MWCSYIKPPQFMLSGRLFDDTPRNSDLGNLSDPTLPTPSVHTSSQMYQTRRCYINLHWNSGTQECLSKVLLGLDWGW